MCLIFVVENILLYWDHLIHTIDNLNKLKKKYKKIFIFRKSLKCVGYLTSNDESNIMLDLNDKVSNNFSTTF